MILPLRVLGKLSPNRMSLGLAIGPISLATQSRNNLAMALASSPVGRARLSTTKAQIASPVVSSGRPTTAASATNSVYDTNADSISIVPMRCPDTLSTSSIRPVMVKSPVFASRIAPSPAR